MQTNLGKRYYDTLSMLESGRLPESKIDYMLALHREYLESLIPWDKPFEERQKQWRIVSMIDDIFQKIYLERVVSYFENNNKKGKYDKTINVLKEVIKKA